MIKQIERESILKFQDVLKEIKHGLLDLLNLSKQLLLFILYSSKSILYNYSEFSYYNIKKQGLKEIVYKRALRFFKLDNSEQNEKKRNAKTVKKKTAKSFIKKVIKLFFIPFYFLLVFTMLIKDKKNIKKSKNFHST
jgi:hypothetical protein